MAKKGNAKRYAQAVFEIALEKKELDRWQSDLSNIVRLADDATIAAFLESPKFHFNDKAKLLSEQFGDMNPLALNLVYLLIAKGRLSMTSDIAVEYQHLLDSYRGIEPAEIVTAIPLGDEDKSRLAERLGAAINKKVVLKSEVDSSLIGGIIARFGGKLLDGSTRHQLMALKKELGGISR